MDESGTKPAGWYRDNNGQLRWWDGMRWTEKTQGFDGRNGSSVPTVVIPTSAQNRAAGATGATATKPQRKIGASTWIVLPFAAP